MQNLSPFACFSLIPCTPVCKYLYECAQYKRAHKQRNEITTMCVVCVHRVCVCYPADNCASAQNRCVCVCVLPMRCMQSAPHGTHNSCAFIPGLHSRHRVTLANMCNCTVIMQEVMFARARAHAQQLCELCAQHCNYRNVRLPDTMIHQSCRPHDTHSIEEAPISHIVRGSALVLCFFLSFAVFRRWHFM